MWAKGSAEGLGVEYWSDRKGWTRAPEGVMTVFPVLYGIERAGV